VIIILKRMLGVNNWFDLAQDRKKESAFVVAAVNLRIP
jgi:hypothetical protein